MPNTSHFSIKKHEPKKMRFLKNYLASPLVAGWAGWPLRKWVSLLTRLASTYGVVTRLVSHEARLAEPNEEPAMWSILVRQPKCFIITIVR
jgi:hypothetical protein